MKTKLKFGKFVLVTAAIISLADAPVYAQDFPVNRHRNLFVPQTWKSVSETKASASASDFRPRKSRRPRTECKILFGNSTEWIVKIYVNGNYRGAIGAWDDAMIYYDRGYTTIYARADFTDGKYKYWGPSQLHCNGHTPVFKIVS